MLRVPVQKISAFLLIFSVWFSAVALFPIAASAQIDRAAKRHADQKGKKGEKG